MSCELSQHRPAAFCSWSQLGPNLSSFEFSSEGLMHPQQKPAQFTPEPFPVELESRGAEGRLGFSFSEHKSAFFSVTGTDSSVSFAGAV